MKKIFLAFVVFIIINNSFTYSRNFFVKNGGNPDASCIEESSACDSIKTVSQKISSATTLYILSSDLSLESSDVMIFYSIYIKPKDKGVRTKLYINDIYIENEWVSVFVLDGYSSSTTLKFENIRFIINDNACESEAAFFEGRMGKISFFKCIFDNSYTSEEDDHILSHGLIDSVDSLVLDSCEFYSFTVSTSLLSFDSLFCSGCIFKNIKRKNGDGSVMNVNSKDININDCKFINCCCMNGNGGAIYASLLMRNSFIIKGVDSVSCFVDCKAKRIAEEDGDDGIKIGDEIKSYGGAIYLQTYGELKEFIISDVSFTKSEKEEDSLNFGSFFFFESNSVALMWNKKNTPFMNSISADNNEYMFSMLSDLSDCYSLWRLFNDEVIGDEEYYYVGESNAEEKDCLKAESACTSLTKVFNKVKTSRINIKIVGSCGLEMSTTFNKGNTFIKKNSEDSELLIKYYCQFINQVDTHFDSISLILQKLFNNRILFSCLKGCLTLFDVSVLCTEDAKFTSVDNIIYIANKGEVVLDNCWISGIVSQRTTSPDSFSVIKMDGGFLTLNSSEVIKCQKESGFGCAMYLTISENSKIKIVGGEKMSAFKRCKAEKGGALYIACYSMGDVFLSDITFGKDNEANLANVGENIFVICSFLNIFINENTFPLLFLLNKDDNTTIGVYKEEAEEEDYYHLNYFVRDYLNHELIYVGIDGIDQESCGSKENICSSLDYVISKFKYFNNNIKILKSLSLQNNLIEFNNIEYNIEGDEKDSSIVCEKDSCFDVKSKLSLRNFNFYITESFVSDDSECLIKISSESEVFLIYVSFLVQKNDILLNNCLINGNGKYFYIEGCCFSFIKTEFNKASCLNGFYKCFIMNNVSFNSCSSNNGFGGAVYLEMRNECNAFIESNNETSSVNNCSAKFGGGIFVYIDDKELLYMKSIIFGKGMDANQADFGRNLFVKARFLNEVVSKYNVPILVGLDDDDDSYIGCYNINLEQMRKNVDLPFYSLVLLANNKIPSQENRMLYIGYEGSDSNTCDGKEINELCFTFDFAFKVIENGVKNITIVNYLEISTVVLKGIGFNIYGDNSRATISPDDELSFDIYTDVLIDNLIFLLSEEKNNNLMKVNMGNLVMNSVSVSPFSDVCFMRNSLISVSSIGSLMLKKCLIKNINGFGVNGSVINAVISNNESLIIKSTIFEVCVCSSGDGGAIFAEISEGGSLIIGAEEDEVNTSFIKCRAEDSDTNNIINNNNNKVVVKNCVGCGGALFLRIISNKVNINVNNVVFGSSEESEDISLNNKNSAMHGNNLFIESKILSDIFKKEFFSISLSLTDLNDEVGIEEDGFEGVEEKYIPLFSVISLPSEFYVDCLSKSSPFYCGFDNYPCSSMEEVVNKQYDKEKMIIIKNLTSVNNSIVLNDTSYNFTNSDDEFNITIDTGCSFIININSSFISFSFILSPYLSKNVIKQCSGFLTLYDVSFIQLEKIGTYSFSSSVISLEPSSSAEICLCLFKDISGSNVDGGVIHAIVSSNLSSTDENKESSCSSLVIKGSSFINCKVNNGNGGALYVSLNNNDEFIIDSEDDIKTIFRGCCSEEFGDEEKGRGGAIYLFVEESYKRLFISGVIFGGEDNDNFGVGKDIFVYAKHLNNVANKETFFFLNEKPENYDGVKGMEIGSEVIVNIQVKEKNNYWWIIVIVVVFVCLIVVIIVIIVIVIVRKKRYKDISKTEEMIENDDKDLNKL